ncbi:hypothetical protein [Ferrimonas marina]|uniref:hypothetical protein n=1 Tax=Ferrimonas marina TaxID=299255 RepID=UPI0011611F17|nr:hypothetical protein [Ferrimonas marina]
MCKHKVGGAFGLMLAIVSYRQWQGMTALWTVFLALIVYGTVKLTGMGLTLQQVAFAFCGFHLACLVLLLADMFWPGRLVQPIGWALVGNLVSLALIPQPNAALYVAAMVLASVFSKFAYAPSVARLGVLGRALGAGARRGTGMGILLAMICSSLVNAVMGFVAGFVPWLFYWLVAATAVFGLVAFKPRPTRSNQPVTAKMTPLQRQMFALSWMNNAICMVTRQFLIPMLVLGLLADRAPQWVMPALGVIVSVSTLISLLSSRIDRVPPAKMMLFGVRMMAIAPVLMVGLSSLALGGVLSLGTAAVLLLLLVVVEQFVARFWTLGYTNLLMERSKDRVMAMRYHLTISVSGAAFGFAAAGVAMATIGFEALVCGAVGLVLIWSLKLERWMGRELGTNNNAGGAGGAGVPAGPAVPASPNRERV